MLVDLLALLEQPLVAVVAVVHELLREGAVLDAGQDLLHGRAGLLVDDLGAGVVLAVLGRVGDGVVHEVDAALVHEVDDHLHLVVALEVSELGRIASLGQGLEARLDQLDEAAAEHGLLTEEILLGLLLEGGLDDAGAGTADAPAVGERDVPGVAGGVLGHAGQVGHAGALGELTANDVAGALGRAHDDVHVLGGLDVAEVNVEAVGEGEGVAGLEVIFDVLLVDLGLRLVGNEHHDDVGFLGGGVHVAHLETGLLGLRPGAGALAQADAHVAAGVEQVQRVGMALGAVTDDGNLLVLDDLRIAVGLVVDRHSHCCFSLTDRGLCNQSKCEPCPGSSQTPTTRCRNKTRQRDKTRQS